MNKLAGGLLAAILVVVAVVAVVVIVVEVQRGKESDPAKPRREAGKKAGANAAGPNGEIRHRPPMMFATPDFSLTDQDGLPFGTEQLFGRAWIANFMFTRCQSTCPVQTARLAELQKDLFSGKLNEPIRFVSFTVDPTHDTSEVLKKYATEAGANELYWKFLTGPAEDIWSISKNGFKLPVAEDAADAKMPIAHSPKFALVDPQGQVLRQRLGK